MILFLLIFLQTFSNELTEIRSTTQIVEGLGEGQKLEIQHNLVPKKLLPKLVGEILKREKIHHISISYDETRSSQELKEDLTKVAQNNNKETRTFNEKTIAGEEPSLLSKKEINNYRIMLLVRTVGLGAGLYVSTGSSLGVAAYGAIFNYLMMEALYIPKQNGHMRGVDFVNYTMKKAAASATKQEPNMGKKRLATIEGFTNVLTNYTMNVAMLIPFVGMTGADFSLYLDSLLQMETYQRAISIGVMTTLFMASWKMAVSRWEELKRERGIAVPSRKAQSRFVNGVDFFLSFINPGFWAGHLANQVVVTVIGVGGWVAYFYHDIKDYLVEKTKPFRTKKYQTLQCRRMFL